MRPYRFRFLLVVLLLELVLLPFLPDGASCHIFSRLLHSVTLLAVVLTLWGQRIRVGWLLLMALFAVSGNWVEFAFGVRLGAEYHLPVVRLVSDFCFLAITTVLMFRSVIHSGNVTGDEMAGTLCVYLLTGICWSYTYAILEQVSPGSFHVIHPPSHAQINQFVYYSFVTMTTLGFGDTVPVTDPARTLTWIQAVGGIFYIATIVARFVAQFRRDG